MTFGLTEGWWRFADRELRPAHPLLDAPRWCALLERAGFEDPSPLSATERGEQALERGDSAAWAKPFSVVPEAATAAQFKNVRRLTDRWIIVCRITVRFIVCPMA